MHTDTIAEALEPFFDEGLVSDVLYPIKSGKEATVYCCQAGPRLPAELVAAKVYKPRQLRSFRDDAVYREGRVILDRRAARAVARRTGFGQEVRSALWTSHEYETLALLHRVGADVPRPLARSAGGLLLEFVGDDDGPAPTLREVALDPAEAQPLLDRLLRNVEQWLACNVVHADLSPFNVLYWQGQPTVIDFPQAVDPRANPNAFTLLARDLANLGRYFARYGAAAEPAALADGLWDRYTRGLL